MWRDHVWSFERQVLQRNSEFAEGVRAAATAADTGKLSTDACCSDTFVCTLCRAGVRALFDQFKVEQTNSMTSVVGGLTKELREDYFQLKAAYQQNTSNI